MSSRPKLATIRCACVEHYLNAGIKVNRQVSLRAQSSGLIFSKSRALICVPAEIRGHFVPSMRRAFTLSRVSHEHSFEFR